MKKKKIKGAKHISAKSGRGCFFVNRVDLEVCVGFPSSSAGKESTCNTGDLGSIPGLGRSLGEGNSYPLQCCWLEDSMDRGAWWEPVHEVAKSQT